MDIQNLVPVDYSNRRVLLTAQVAEVFNTTTERISHNFCENKQHFKEGEHFFKLTGAALRSFKETKNQFVFSKNANVIYLWTVSGIILHAKMLNTERAWEIFSQITVAMKDSADLNEIIFKHVSQPEPKNNLACVYILELSDLTVKIGMTNDFDRRQNAIRCMRKVKVLREYHTDFAPRESMLSLERAIQHTFKKHLAYGSEYFSITFEDALAELERLLRDAA